MAEEATAPVDATAANESTSSQTSESTTPESSDAPALTPEQRDAQTFARHGLKPDGSPLDSSPETPPEKPAKAAKDKPDAADDDADSDPDGDKAGDDDEDEETDDAEITDERVSSILESLLELRPDLVKANPKVREQIAAEIRAELQGEADKERSATTASQERARLMKQGEDAVNGIVGLMTKAQAELAKAKLGQDDVDWDVLAKMGEDLPTSLGLFSAASVVSVRQEYDASFTAGFLAAQAVAGKLTDEEADQVRAIVNSANRIEADEKQGDGRWLKAKQHMYTETWKLTAQRAFDAGKAAAVAEAKAKRDAKKGILDADTVIAAQAKEAAKRTKLPPPPTPGAGASTTGTAATMEAYQAAKRDGNYELADKIAARMRGVPAH